MTEKYAATILIVDDDVDIAELLESVVSAMGNYRTLISYSGKEALEIVEKDPPDLVLLDIMLQDIDGTEVCRTIKGNEKTSGIKVIALTAIQENEVQRYQEVIDSGVDDYVTKPFSFDELKMIVRRHLNKDA